MNLFVLLSVTFMTMQDCESLGDINQRFKVITGKAVPYGHPFRTRVTRGLLDCLVLCTHEAGCQSVMFEPDHKVCTTNRDAADHSSVAVACNGTMCSSKYTPVKYATVINGKRGIRESCSHDSDCDVAMSACRHGVCLCYPGYSYRSNARRCVISCISYGATYQPDEGRALQFSQQGAHSGITSESACQALCQHEPQFTCRTYGFSAALRLCQLWSFTAYEQPHLYTAAPGFTLNTRDCGY